MRLLGKKNKFLKTQGKEKFNKSVGHALDGIEYAVNHERNGLRRRNERLEVQLAVIGQVELVDEPCGLALAWRERLVPAAEELAAKLRVHV